MKLVVTGVAGFIGSHLAERALAEGHDVTGIDGFIDYYPRSIKERNLTVCRSHSRFRFVEGNILDLDLDSVCDGAAVVYHLAAQAGVRASWGKQFRIYTDCNVLGTQRVLEAARNRTVSRVVYASSSSVYGDAVDLPMKETAYPRPVSPYGVTKLAGENLCVLYTSNYGLPTVSLRYFTVYGPRQRPDMAFHLFIRAALRGESPEIFGSGEQTRDFTFVDDAVDVTFRAGLIDGISGEVFNVGGGNRCSINTIFEKLESVMGVSINPHRKGVQKGDVRHTAADTSRAARLLNFIPRVTLDEGLSREVEWVKELYERHAGGENGR
ncbi:NAD-dependent epimerase/dehydratase family protein [bacterium]|nr:NAD-dependent epimerase/dehydratase family protein [candidate division CSSED10-310 bacterium]